MSEISNITAKGMEPMKQKLVETYKAKGMKASGEFEDSLEIVEIPNGAVLLGAGHALQLEVGRGITENTTSSGGTTVLEAIRQWIKDKGIIPEDISEESLARAITHKIHNQGWDRSGHGGLNLISDSIKDSDFQSIIDEVFKLEQNKITESLISILKG